MKTVVGLPWEEVKTVFYDIDDFLAHEKRVTPALSVYFTNSFDVQIVGFESQGDTVKLQSLFRDRFFQEPKVYIMG